MDARRVRGKTAEKRVAVFAGAREDARDRKRKKRGVYEREKKAIVRGGTKLRRNPPAKDQRVQSGLLVLNKEDKERS